MLGVMKSVPPRGSGWVSNDDFNVTTHPLPRGGTDLMGPHLSSSHSHLASARWFGMGNEQGNRLNGFQLTSLSDHLAEARCE
jgi:hypothetical protein